MKSDYFRFENKKVGKQKKLFSVVFLDFLCYNRNSSSFSSYAGPIPEAFLTLLRGFFFLLFTQSGKFAIMEPAN